MKNPNSLYKIMFFFFFIGILMVMGLICTVNSENEFYKSEFRKKVERVITYRNIDCICFTDGTSKCFSAYSVIDEKDTLVGVRVISGFGIGDSIVKRKNEAFIRVVRK